MPWEEVGRAAEALKGNEAVEITTPERAEAAEAAGEADHAGRAA